MKNNSMVLVIVALIIGLVSGFFGGMKYQENKTLSLNSSQNSPFNRQDNRTGINRQNQRTRMAFRPVLGEIIKTDDKSITVKLQDGSSKIILFNNKTLINKAEFVTKSDLKVGEKVSTFGTENADGSITAVSIQLNPLQRMVNGNNSPIPPSK